MYDDYQSLRILGNSRVPPTHFWNQGSTLERPGIPGCVGFGDYPAMRSTRQGISRHIKHHVPPLPPNMAVCHGGVSHNAMRMDHGRPSIADIEIMCLAYTRLPLFVSFLSHLPHPPLHTPYLPPYFPFTPRRPTSHQKKKGFMSLYRGIPSPLVGSMMENSVLFTSYGFAGRMIR